MAGNYSKKLEMINGHDVWKHDAYNFDQYLISYQAKKGWFIGSKIGNGGNVEGIYGPSNVAIHCPALVGNKWEYSVGNKNIYKKSQTTKGGEDISVKCLGICYFRKIQYILRFDRQLFHVLVLEV